MRVIFLDRDGVINRYPGDREYVTSWRKFYFLPGVLKAIRILTDNQYKIFIISNQAGISKGLYTKKTLDQMTRNMLKKIKKENGEIERVFYCIHRTEDNCSCRKPKTGLIKKALGRLNKKISSNNTYFIGDSIRDVKTGKRAHLKTILVLSGKETLKNKNTWSIKPDYVTKNLLEATKIILNENRDNIRIRRKRTSKRR